MNLQTKREKFFFYNSLAILLKAVEKERTTVDLRNESSVYGRVEQADAFMNIVMKDCVFTDPRGDSYNFEVFFIQARNIRCVHIPPKIRIIPAIKQQLEQLRTHPIEAKNIKTFKQKRAQQRQQEGIAAVEKILEDRKKSDVSSTKNDDD